MKQEGALILVYDVGGSHIGAALARVGEAELLAETTRLLDSEAPAEIILELFASSAHELLQKQGLSPAQIAGAAIGMPNPFDYEQGISYMRHKYTQLFGVNLRLALAQKLSVAPESVHFVNDASAYLLGEIAYGAAQGYSRVVGLTLGTGIGSAFAVDGEIVTEGLGVPEGGFLWDQPLDGGIVEDLISTRAIQKVYVSFTGTTLSVREIAKRVVYDAAARATWRQFGGTLASVLQRTCTEFEPQAIVLGGAIAKSSQLFLPAASQQMPGVKILASTLFDKASLLGAGVAWAAAR
jgi:glucokinase